MSIFRRPIEAFFNVIRSLDQVSANRFPVKSDDGELFEDSPVSVVRDGGGVATDVVFDVPATIPSGTLSLGGVLDNGQLIRGVTELKDSGESFLASDNVTGLIHTIPLTLINDDLNAPFGVGRTRVQDGDPFIWSSFGGVDTDEITISGDEKVIVEFREVLTAYITAQRFRGTQGKVHYRVFDLTANDGIDTLVYTSEQGDPIDFDTAQAPDFQIEYDTFNPNFLIQDHILRLEWFSADGNPVTLKGTQTGAIPPSGDITTFTPFFETKFSTTRERIIFPNDEIIRVNGNFQPDESAVHAIDTSSNPVTLNIDPDFTKQFTVIDAANSFKDNPCTVELRIYNTRNTPNDNIGAISADAILAANIDAGASGTKNALSTGTTPKFYNNGTHWCVVTDSETLVFDEVTNRSGLVFFRLLGERAALTIGDQTQLLYNVTGTTVDFDTIGNVSDPIDEIFHLQAVVDRSLVFDDDAIGETVVLNVKNTKMLFYYEDNVWYQYDVHKSIDQYPKGGMCMEGNLTATPFLAAGTPEEMQGTFMAHPNNREFDFASNTLTYTGRDKDFDVFLTASVEKVTGSGGVSDTMRIYVYVNGSPVGCSSAAALAVNDAPVDIVVIAPLTLTDGDEITIWIENEDSTASALITDLSMVVR
jgi:hypothetical protein